MKAVLYSKKDKTSRLTIQEIAKPIPGDNEVLIKIKAVSLNAADYRSMQMGLIPKGKIFGADIAGTVESVGRNVKYFKIGDEVVGDLADDGFGGLAEYVSADEKTVVKKAPGISFETAAAVPMSAVTAYQALRNKGNVQKGQRVLIYGAGGGVGLFAVQLAKYYGAVVTAVCSEKSGEIVKNLGADEIIDYTKEDISTKRVRYDVIIAVNGNNTLATYMKLLTSNGICVVLGGKLSQILKTMIFGRFISLGSKKILLLAAKNNNDDLAFVMKLVDEGKLKVVIDRRYSLEETPEAFEYLKKGHAKGKIIIQIDKEE